VGGLFGLRGETQIKLAEAGPGDTVALGRLEEVMTGETLSSAKAGAKVKLKAETLIPVYSLAITAHDRKDEVKLTGAIHRLQEEDPSLHFHQNAELQEMSLEGQGEIHLKVAAEKLLSKYGLKIDTHRTKVPYKETIKKPGRQHGRHKRQSGGHGQFGDVHLEIKPMPRGTGFEFVDHVVGGAVPRQYISSVEEGAREFLNRGPLGFPVVDVSVTLYDGQYHTVDSSDMAFKTAARIAMSEGMPKCEPVLLEPICAVQITIPNDFTARVHGLISGRRGQILGFSAKEGWQGWDEVNAYLPQSELHDLIIELRSLTMGVGTFSWKFDHLQELTGRLADKIVEHRLTAAH
jgi:elongation factor G